MQFHGVLNLNFRKLLRTFEHLYLSRAFFCGNTKCSNSSHCNYILAPFFYQDLNPNKKKTLE